MSDEEKTAQQRQDEDHNEFRLWLHSRATDRQELGDAKYEPQSYLKRDSLIEVSDELFDALFYMFMHRRYQHNRSSLAFRVSDLIGDWEESCRSNNKDREETSRLQITGLLVNEGIIKVHYTD